MLKRMGPLLAASLLLTCGRGVWAAKSNPGGKEETIVCPVMKLKVPKSRAIKVIHDGKTYYVCCAKCAAQIESGKFKP